MQYACKLLGMCIARILANTCGLPADVDVDEGVERDANVFAVTPTDHTLDDIFEMNVFRPIMSQVFDNIAKQMQEIEQTRSRLGLPIILLRSTTRQNIHMPSDVFWSVVVSPGQAVSQYYQRACMQDRSGKYAIEPCSSVVGDSVILCIQLYFDISNVIVYRDILTSLHTTLQTALCNFSSVLGFAPETRYTFLVHDEVLGWKTMEFPDAMLAMSMWEVLLRPSVRECCAVDYFRLSPIDVGERESDGVLLCTETRASTLCI